jgi:sulfide:quinone oxidoreductase
VGGIDRAAAALRAFDGGVIAVVIFGAPYTCPPAPYEVAFLVNDRMRRAGIHAQIDVFSPQPVSLPVVGAVGCQTLETRLADEGIAFHPNHHAVSVEPGEVVFQEGRYPFDLLFGVPPHRCPPIVVSAGLTDGRAWVPVDPATMATRVPGVYAVGDMVEIPTANGLTLPKAGVFAEAQARVAAEHIAALLRGGTSPATFEGDGFCYLEVGQGMALEVRGDFLAAPAPAVVVGEPRADLLEEKHRFEAERLARWFGE